MAHGAVLQLHIATLNTYTFFTGQHPEFNNGIISAWQIFLIELSKQLEKKWKNELRLPPNCKVCDFHSLNAVSPESI